MSAVVNPDRDLRDHLCVLGLYVHPRARLLFANNINVGEVSIEKLIEISQLPMFRELPQPTLASFLKCVLSCACALLNVFQYKTNTHIPG